MVLGSSVLGASACAAMPQSERTQTTALNANGTPGLAHSGKKEQLACQGVATILREGSSG